jgi:hypothetical protein
MKLILVVMMVVALVAVQGVSGEERLRDACEQIPRRALERADTSLKRAYPGWGVVPVMGDDGDWRCRTSGVYARRYGKTAEGKRMPDEIPLYVDKNGGIYICDRHGCFSIDRWK